MAVHELSDEQVHTMTLEQKDEWWLKNVYRGDMPQLTIRSAITGVFLGGILSLTNLYIGIRTGWALGVGISSVILSFAIFKVLSKLSIGKEMTILENNAMQSIATNAGYMTAPLMASLPAYMMATGTVIPMYQTFWWIIVLAILGVLFAFPFKKRFINDEQMPFPEGRACGIVLDNLHEDSGQGMFKAKLLMAGAFLSAAIEVMRSEKVMGVLKLSFLTLPDTWDGFLYKFFTPRIAGISLKDLSVSWDSSIVMIGTGGLMDVRSGMSLLLGAFTNFFILAPIMMNNGVIQGAGFRAITSWGLWIGASMMTTASLWSFFSKPKVFIEVWHLMTGKHAKRKDVLENIELPMKVFVIGIPLISLITIYMGHEWFGISWWLGILAIPIVFILSLIGVTSTGLTSITPGSALGQLTQVTYSILAPGNISTNLITAGMSSEVALNASNLLSDIKPAYMLGGKPRHQAIGHVIGIFAGACVAVPVYYAIFHNDISLFTSEKLPLPSVLVWNAVAKVLAKGLGALHPTSQIGVLIGGLFGVFCEIMSKRTKGRWPISGVAFGLAFILQFTDSLSMALGSFLCWYARRSLTNKKTFSYRAFVDNQETVAAGIVAGGSIIGIVLILMENVVLR
jgi:putative OPT family oligopeptide transporter